MTYSLTRRAFGAAFAAGLLGSVALPALAQETKTYALVQINQQALFFNEMNRGAQEAADAAGVKLVIFNANNDSAAQNSAIETYIQEGVAGLAVVAIDVNGIMPAVEQADTAGIPVVAIDAILPDDGPQKAQIGVDNAKAGADLAAYYNGTMTDASKLGIVGALNSYIQNVRKDGFEEALNAGSVTVAGTVDGQNVQDVALSAAENLITAYPDLTSIYATGEPALMGAIAAVASQGKQDDLAVFGWDLTAQAVDAIDDGYLKAVIQQDPAGMGAAAIEALIALDAGEEVESNIAVPVTIVTSENVDDFRSLFE